MTGDCDNLKHPDCGNATHRTEANLELLRQDEEVAKAAFEKAQAESAAKKAALEEQIRQQQMTEDERLRGLVREAIRAFRHERPLAENERLRAIAAASAKANEAYADRLAPLREAVQNAEAQQNAARAKVGLKPMPGTAF